MAFGIGKNMFLGIVCCCSNCVYMPSKYQLCFATRSHDCFVEHTVLPRFLSSFNWKGFAKIVKKIPLDWEKIFYKKDAIRAYFYEKGFDFSIWIACKNRGLTVIPSKAAVAYCANSSTIFLPLSLKCGLIFRPRPLAARPMVVVLDCMH